MSAPATPVTAPALLVANGTLLAITIIIARLAGGGGAPMLWFLTIVMAGGGTILLVAAFLTGNASGGWGRRLAYSVGAGGFQAASMAMAFLSVAHVGAGYVSLVFAFPLLLTYVLALAVRMERFETRRAIGVVLALAGGLLIASAKFNGLSASGEGVGWVLVASAIPVVLAGGNLYRTRFWPSGAQPVLLAALMLLLASVATGAVSAFTENSADIAGLWTDPILALLTALNIVAFALKFVVYFRLQQVAGPVYLSQIGSVGAAVGVPVSVVFLGETLPPGFTLAVILIVAGATLFQIAARATSRQTVPTGR